MTVKECNTRYYLANKEKLQTYQKEYHEINKKDIEWVKKKNESNKKYRDNPKYKEKLKEYGKKYRDKNKDKIRKRDIDRYHALKTPRFHEENSI